MIDAASLLPKILTRAGNDHQVALAAAKVAWTRVAGDGLRRHALPARLESKTLVVSVADAVWQKQLQSMAAELIFRINKVLQTNVVESIEFQVDPAALRKRANDSTSKRSEMKLEPLPSSVISSSAQIEDAELRERFMRAAANCIARRETLKDIQ